MGGPSRKKRRSCCPLACTLDLVGDKWTLLVIRDLMSGKSHFRDFARSPEGIASNILTNRLDRLLEHDLIEQVPSNELPGRYAYRLTDRGRTLEPVMQAIADWGLEQIEGTEIRIKPKQA